MNKRVRDYKQEYVNRIKRAEVLARMAGITISRSQARGHARPHAKEAPMRKLQGLGVIPRNTTSTLKKYAAVIKLLAKGESLTAASRKSKTTTNTIKRIGLGRGDLSTIGERHVRLVYRAFKIYTKDGVIHDAVQVDKRTSSIVGKYLNLVRDAHASEWNRRKLAAFKPKTINDVFGKRYQLATDYGTLLLMGAFDGGGDGKQVEDVVYRTDKVA